MDKETKKDKMHIGTVDDRLSGFAERHPSLLKWLSKVESFFGGDEIRDKRIDRPVYVCGLARSGTTILLEMLASHPDAATHRYRDFPFVLTPLWWNWFVDHAGGADAEPVERFHKDRIYITGESPEAMEEIIWMTFFSASHDPTVSNVIGPDVRGPEFEEFYRDHIRKILALRQGKRYIAKNNYNVTRLAYLKRLFPDCRMIVTVRDPVSHIASLLKQHRLFCEEEKEDRRITDYMRRMGHFEFGTQRRPINANDSAAVESILTLWERGDEARGLARLWASVYSYAVEEVSMAQELKDAVIFVHYDDLCSDSFTTLERIYRHCELEMSIDKLEEQASRLSRPSYYSIEFSDRDLRGIEEETRQVHDRIRLMCKGDPSGSPNRPHS